MERRPSNIKMDKMGEACSTDERYCYNFLIFYCCAVHIDNIKILFTDKCTLLLNIQNVQMYS
jgi:hypothetical protein